MKSFIASGLLAMSLFGFYAPAQADSFKTKRCMNMGNALDAPNEGEWGHKIEAQSFKLIADAGFDTVRIPVRWSAHTGGAPNYQIDERFFRRVTQVINQALSNDLQIILNIHHFEELNEAPEAHYNKFIALWAQIARRYKDLPDSVYFEIVNEPNGKFEGDLMRNIVTQAFKKIRETNPTRILIMGGDEWSNIKTLPTIPLISDPNQVHTFHYYDPFEFTHQKASWTYLKNSGAVAWGDAADQAQLRDAAQYAASVQRNRGIKVFLGEIGAYEKAPYRDIVNYTRATREAFEAVGIGWCAWNFTATFPFYDSDTRRWDNNKLAALGLSPDRSWQTADRASPPAPRSSSVQGRSLDDAFNRLRRRIGDGELIMAPYADQLSSYGAVKTKVISDSGAPGGTAMEVNVRRRAANPWDGGLSGPIGGAIRRGDTIMMSFWAKTMSGEGVISNAGLQLNRAPYTAITLKPLNVGREWQQFFVSVTATRDYAPSESGYVIHTAGAKQALRFGPVFVLNLGQNIDRSKLPEH